MKLGRKQTIYGVVLGAAAVAFVIDRIFFSPPAAGAAPAMTARPAHAEPQAAPAVPVTVSQAVPAGWLADRLRAATRKSSQDLHDAGLRDVFVAPAGWRPARPATAVVSAPKVPLFADAFRREHHLGGIVIEGHNSRAIVDGQLIPVGQEFDGFRLVSLSRQSAQFVRGEEQVLLSLPDATASGPR